jgi:hypothetical protein
MTDTGTVPANVVPDQKAPRAKTVLVSAVSLPVEAAQAALGGVIAGLGTFTGSLTVTSASNTGSLKAAGVGAGFTFLVFFTNSFRNWYSQKYGASA